MSGPVSADDPFAFDKYLREGAYHWQQMDKRWRNSVYSPPLEARYTALVRRIPMDARDILEVGCGDGRLLWAVAEARPQAALAGVDTDATGVALAQSRMQQTGVSVVIQRGSVHQLPFASDAFDVVLLADVVEHLVDPSAALLEILRVLKPKGVLVLSTPHRQPDFVWDELHHVHEFDHIELRALLATGFDEVQLSACSPMVWVRLWRRHSAFRFLLRALGRLGFNPLLGDSARASLAYAQIIAVSRKPSAPRPR
jgi:SAM-dependent methyltransferase